MVLVSTRCAAALCVAFSLTSCESIPQLQTAPFASSERGKLTTLSDQRSEIRRSSLVERSGSQPIVLLGDERFDVRPIEVLDRELGSVTPASANVSVKRFDVRYIQGGNLDSLTYGMALGVSGAGAILGTVLYGAMAGHARSKNPSTLEIFIEGTVETNVFSLKHVEALTGANEAHEIRRVVEVAVKKAVDAIGLARDQK